MHFLAQDTTTNETNIGNLPFVSTIPIMSQTFGQRIEEIKKKKDSEKIFDLSKDPSKMPQIDLNVVNDPEHRFFKWKLLSKLIAFYFCIFSLTRGNFGNTYHYLFVGVLAIYY